MAVRELKIGAWGVLTEILAQANGFSLDDLKANQNGEVTDAQRWAGLLKD